jgi:hypothetical protein
MRWNLNDMARRLDKETPAAELDEAIVASPDSSESTLHRRLKWRLLLLTEQLSDLGPSIAPPESEGSRF